MDESDTESKDYVTASVEINGKYEEVVSRIGGSPDQLASVEELTGDLTTLLETVDQIDGGTKSAIATALPDHTTVNYDGDAVVEALQLLARYDLVVLDGNTWNAGPALHL